MALPQKNTYLARRVDRVNRISRRVRVLSFWRLFLLRALRPSGGDAQDQDVLSRS